MREIRQSGSEGGGSKSIASPYPYNLHPLIGDRKGTWSVRVSGNWRVTFRFEGEDIRDVDYEDYH